MLKCLKHSIASFDFDLAIARLEHLNPDVPLSLQSGQVFEHSNLFHFVGIVSLCALTRESLRSASFCANFVLRI